MVTIRRGFLWAACTAAGFPLLAGCGILNTGTGSTPTLMSVGSEAFGPTTLPAAFTCHAGKAVVTPPVDWSGAPADTKSFALVVDDASAPISPYIYWVVYNISPASSDIEQGLLPPGARQAPNSAGTARYDPPCPRGSAHKYRFTVYALSSMLSLPAGASLPDAWEAIAAASIDYGRISVTANP
jgi:Raf kinase inhibitor-like YbhB/YbcL family protein